MSGGVLVLTCTAEPWWWDRSRCAHGPEAPCSGPRGCRVLESVAEEQRLLWSARRRETLNMARTYAIRQLRREGWAEERWPSLLVWVLEDQSRGVPHLHFVLGLTTALEKTFARAFFRELKSAAYVHGLGHTSTHERPCSSKGEVRGGPSAQLRREARAVSRQVEGAAEFLFGTRGARVFYVAPWLSALSGVTMTVARLSRRVWAARKGYCAMPKMTAEHEQLVARLGRWSRLQTHRERPPAGAPPPVGSAWGPRVSEANARAGPTGRGRALDSGESTVGQCAVLLPGRSELDVCVPRERSTSARVTRQAGFRDDPRLAFASGSVVRSRWRS